MKLGKVALEKLKEPGNSIEFWREQVKVLGVKHVKKLLEGPIPISDVWQISARQAVEEYEEDQQKQADRKRVERDNRDIEALKVASESNQIADVSRKESKREARMAWAVPTIISVVGIMVAIILAQLSKTP